MRSIERQPFRLSLTLGCASGWRSVPRDSLALIADVIRPAIAGVTVSSLLVAAASAQTGAEETVPDVAALFPAPPPTPTPQPPELEKPSPSGVPLGKATLQPSVTLSLIRGDLFPNVDADRPVKVRETFFEISPRLGLELPLRADGALRVAYEPSFRTLSDLDVITEPAHRASGSLELPIGANVRVRAADTWSRGILDVAQVDPGAEYFSRLASFTHNLFDVSGRLEGADTSLDGGVTWNRVTMAPGSGFFSHRSRSYYAGVGRRLGGSLNLRLGFSHERVPRSAERPEAETRSNVYTATLDGALAPLTEGQITVGYRDQKAPNAGAGGQRFKGFVIAGRIEKEFTPATRLSIWGSRDTRADLNRRSGLYRETLGVPELALPTLSAFERNAFYVTRALNTELTVPLVLGMAGRGSLTWQRNDYRTIATEIATRRQDRMFGWSVGVGRPLTRHAWLRADFVRQRRDSNIDRIDVKTEVLLVQLGIGFAGGAGRPAFVGAAER